MNRSIVVRLIAKDLYLCRGLIGGTLAVGVLSLVAAGADGATGDIGGIVFVTTIVLLGIFLAMYGVLSERQSKSLLFTLSLPLSPMQYVVAKVSASLIAFLIPWTALTGVLVGDALLSGTSDTPLPVSVAMMGFFLANFCVLLAIGVVTRSEFWAIAGIVGTNTAVPVFLAILLPAIEGDAGAPGWSAALLTTLALELVVMVLALGLAFLVQSRRRDYV